MMAHASHPAPQQRGACEREAVLAALSAQAPAADDSVLLLRLNRSSSARRLAAMLAEAACHEDAAAAHRGCLAAQPSQQYLSRSNSGGSASTSSSMDWNAGAAGLPLPRQRSVSAPSSAQCCGRASLDRQLAAAAAAACEPLGPAFSSPLPETVALALAAQQLPAHQRHHQQHSALLPSCFSGPAAEQTSCHQGLYRVGTGSASFDGAEPSSFTSDTDDSAASALWEAAMAMHARQRALTRSHSHGHSHGHSASRSFQSSGSFHARDSPAPMEVAPSPASSAGHAPSALARCPSSHLSARAAPAAAQPQQLRPKALQAIDHELDRLGQLEAQLQQQLDLEAARAASLAAAASPAAVAARHGGAHVGSSRRGSLAHRGGAHGSSFVAALQAANVDAAMLAEYLAYHQQQQAQYTACMAAVHASVSPRAERRPSSGGLGAAAQAKLQQLLAMQRQQIALQQELLAMLPSA